MGMDGAAFAAQRDRDKAGSSGNGEAGQPKVESVVKMFMDPDKIAAILKPLSTRQMVSIFKSLRHLILPIMSLAQRSKSENGAVTLTHILNAFGDNIDDVPKLIHAILMRGNPDLSEEWVLDHFDVILDMQVILPHFMRQNNLDRLFSGKSAAPVEPSSPESASTTRETDTTTAASPQTAESQAESTSAPTTMESQLTTSGTS
jgi:hypothetical protein